MKVRYRVPSLILLAMFVLSVGLSLANTTDYSSIFADDLAIYYDSEIFIYAEAQIAEPQDNNYFEEITAVNLHYSFDMGANWDQHIIPVPDSKTWTHKPVLNEIEGNIVLSIGNTRFNVIPSEGALLVQELPDAEYMPGTDLAPYPFMRNNEEYLFKVDQPYPERIQYEFTKDGTADIRNMPYGVFYEQFKSMNDTTVFWTLPNSLSAPACSRDNFLIHYSNLYPGMFQAPVICKGEMQCPDGIDQSEIFEKGYHEKQDFNGMSGDNPVRAYGTIINGHGNAPDRTIIYLDYQGNNLTAMEGTILTPRRVEVDVYDTYPPDASSTLLYTNSYTVQDTLWSPFSISPGQKNIFVNAELWLKGNFSGHHNISASRDIKIIGDITLANTAAGDDMNTNNEDSVNLISERNVVIAYGYKDPITNERIHPFCRADDDPAYIYANIYAMGNQQRTGLFTFEYQHPHPSTPAALIEEDGEQVLYENIDIHRRKYPPTAAEPWPANLDLPYYNPLWPEANPYKERGKIIVMGNVYQNRKGYVHRSGSDSEYPSNSGVWDVELDMCGGPISAPPIEDPILGITMQAQNYPGASGTGAGYKYEMYPDLRLFELADLYGNNSFIFNHIFDHGINIVNQAGESLPIRHEKVITAKATQKKIFAKRGNKHAFVHNNSIIYDDGSGYLKDLTRLNYWYITKRYNPDDSYKIRDMILSDENTLIVLLSYTGTHHYILEMLLINLQDFTFSNMGSSYSEHEFTSASLSTRPSWGDDDDCFYVAYVTNSELFVNKAWWEAGDDWGEVYYHCYHIPYTLQDNSVPENCSFSLNVSPDTDNTYFPVVLFEDTSGMPYSGWGNVSFKNYHGHVSNEDDHIPSVKDFALSCYPNPARSLIQLKLDTPLHTQHHEVEIYNLRGQKVNSITDTGKKSNTGFEYDWNLRDANNKKVSSGIYFIRVKVDGKTKISKKITVL
ncbi:MAG TPA: T9SS type A sorting domain-containing protein [Candidatus Cloacimonetes bacterium]|nr:T9SS type A sorting domain-containing protein [Candidatus Cloacimonadota bacterium]